MLWLARRAFNGKVRGSSRIGLYIVLCFSLDTLQHVVSLHPDVQMGTGNIRSGVPCDGYLPIQGGMVILLVTLCRVPCDGLVALTGGSCNTPSCLLQWKPK